MLSVFREHTKTLRLMYLVQVTNGFAYYGMFGLLAVYLVKGLDFSEQTSFAVLGSYGALAYCMLSLGGYITDKYLGAKRALPLGLVLLMSGYVLLGMAAIQGVPQFAYFALACTCIGRGLANTCAPTLIAHSYPEADTRIDGAFTMFYMGNNLGSFSARMLFPMIAAALSWSFAFFFSGLSLAVGLISFLMLRHTIKEVGTAVDHQPLKKSNLMMVLAGCIAMIFVVAWLLDHTSVTRMIMGVVAVLALGYFFLEMSKEGARSRKQMIVALVLLAESVLFFVMYNQMYTTLTFYSLRNVDPTVFGITINPISFQALNPLWIIILGPVLNIIYRKLEESGHHVSTATKFGVGMLFSCGAFLTLAASSHFASAEGIVNSNWIVLAHSLQAIAELMISALGLSVLAQLMPKRMTGFAIGSQALTNAGASILAAMLAAFAAIPKEITDPLQTVDIYGNYFMWLGVGAGVIGVLMVLAAKWLDNFMQEAAAEKQELLEPAQA
ncbi:oligopeptide:H+ symporter [Spongorhabdus nitratireducens]